MTGSTVTKGKEVQMRDEHESAADVSAEEDELPSHEALLLDSGLYREYGLDGNYLYVKRMYYGPDIQFDAHCVYCNKVSTFRQWVGNRGGGAGSEPLKDDVWLQPRIIFLEFRCQREPKHAYHYALRVERQAISKIGQSPSLATIAAHGTARFKRVLEQSYLRDLNMAIGLFSHGVGAGSFVYLRRIFEYLLLEAAATARSEGEKLVGFETARMDEKVKALAGHLPEEVVEAAATYSVLSAGIHALSEQQCLALFPVMRECIEFILDGHIAARKRAEHKRDLQRALSEAKNEVAAAARAAKKSPSGTPTAD